MIAGGRRQARAAARGARLRSARPRSAAARRGSARGAPRARRLATLLALGFALGLTLGAAGGSAQPMTQGALLEVAWRADVGRTLGAELAIGPGGIGVTTLDRRCALLDRQSGRKVWSVREGDGIQGGVVESDAGWIGVTDPPGNRLFCLEASTGRARWRRPWVETAAAPIARGGVFFTAGVEGRVAACSTATGAQVWSYAAPEPVRSRLALEDSLLLVPTAGDSLIALSAADGAVRWGAAPGGPLYAPPQRVGERLYALAYTGTLTVIDVGGGERIASRSLPGFYRAGLGGPQPLVAISSAGRVSALRPEDLSILWQRDFDQVAETTPLVAGGLVWLGLRDGSLFGLDAVTGETRYHLRLPAPVQTPVVTDGEMIWVGAGGGEVVACRWKPDRSPAAPSGAGGGRGEADPGRTRRFARAAPGIGAAAWSGVSPLAARTLCRGEDAAKARGLSRWRWPATAAWGVCTALALWLQDRADAEYDRYLSTGSPGARDRALERAEHYDRAVVGSWIVAEIGFAVGVKAWLDAQSGGGKP